MNRWMSAVGVMAAVAAGAADLVPFAPPWDDGAAGPTDIGATIPRPSGAAGFVTVRDGHLFAGDARLRIFGANLTGGACFPDRDTADRLAARMAKFGFNAMRFHFLDSTWSQPRLIDYESGDWRNWNSNALDRFDYFASRLVDRGIYLNLNLLVGRRFGVGDGVDPAINKLDWKAAHAVGFFHGPHLEAQKQYARRLLAHRNPYTGRTYAGDPAVAFVEINNENGLIHTWLSGDFDALPEPFAADLARQWNGWLAKRYDGTAALAKAWKARDEAAGADLLKNADFAAGAEGWNVEQHQGARAEAKSENGTLSFRVLKTGVEDWHVQLNQPGLKLKAGDAYTVRFRAAADRPRTIAVSVIQAHDPWRPLGLYRKIDVGPDWRTFDFTFLAEAGDDNARFGFNGLNQDGAVFRFAEASFRPGGRIGLSAEESLERRSVRWPKAADAAAIPPEARRDWIDFLWETERNHWREMRRFLKQDLGVKAPVVGTIVATSTPNLMGEFDVVDTHAYWQHPHFPGRPWDRNNWYVKNISMADYPAEATLTRLAWQRVEGKPHMVSEYNHPAPNTHAGEAPLMLAAMAALQDWDALFLYTYSHDDSKTKAGRIPDFFDIGQHPTIMANVPAASLLFRRGDLAAARELVRMPLSPDAERDIVARLGRQWTVLPLDRIGLDLTASLVHRVAIDTASAGPIPRAQTSGAGPARAEWVSDTGELSWRLSGKDRGVFAALSPRSKVVVGRVDGQDLDLGHGVRLRVGQTKTGWCTAALTVLDGDGFDGRPKRALLALTGYTENTGMGWKNPEKNTVGSDWGQSPSLVEAVPAVLTLPASAGRPTVSPLDDRGQRQAAIAVRQADEGGFRIDLGPPSRTAWYEIEFAAGL